MCPAAPLSDAASAVNDGRSRRLAGASARRRRGPASALPQLRWLRRSGRGRPLGHRRHRGAVWLPPCPACRKPAQLCTHHYEMATMQAPSAHIVCSVALRATRALIRSGSAANLHGEELARHVCDLLEPVMLAASGIDVMPQVAVSQLSGGACVRTHAKKRAKGSSKGKETCFAFSRNVGGCKEPCPHDQVHICEGCGAPDVRGIECCLKEGPPPKKGKSKGKGKKKFGA